MHIKYNELCSAECYFSDINSSKMRSDDNSVYNFENSGRVKNLIFYQLENQRSYYFENEHICTLNQGDILFLPHGAKYRSFIVDPNSPSGGMGISFNLFTHSGEQIFFDEKIKLAAKDREGLLYKHFKKIHFSVLNPAGNILRLNGELYSLLDSLFASKSQREDFSESFGDIMTAIEILEEHPERNISSAVLADMCHMSESSFMRKFKDYSGGISPIKYRNNIRLMVAEELATSELSISEIAEKTGFYDAAHLCKAYKNAKGTTLKK